MLTKPTSSPSGSDCRPIGYGEFATPTGVEPKQQTNAAPSLYGK